MAKSPKLTLHKVRDAHRYFGRTPAIVPLGATLSRAVDECLRHPDSAGIYVINAQGGLAGVVRLADVMRIASARHQVKKEGVGGLLRYWRDQINVNAVDDVMHTPITVKEDDSLLDALQVMVDSNLTDLPVVDGTGRLVGELNAPDLLRFLREGVQSTDAEEAG